jgi:hypothetical protein
MLAVAIVAFVILDWLGSRLCEAIAVGRGSPDLTEVATHGLTPIARGLMAMAIGLLAGALVGRTMPALLLAAVGVIAWGLVVVPAVQAAMSQDRGVWQSDQDESWREDAPSPIAWVDSGEFDLSRPGLPGEPGARWTEEDWARFERQRRGLRAGTGGFGCRWLRRQLAGVADLEPVHRRPSAPRGPLLEQGRADLGLPRPPERRATPEQRGRWHRPPAHLPWGGAPPSLLSIRSLPHPQVGPC